MLLNMQCDSNMCKSKSTIFKLNPENLSNIKSDHPSKFSVQKLNDISEKLPLPSKQISSQHFAMICINYCMGLEARKPVFWVSDHIRLNPVCSATKTSRKIEILPEA